MEIAVAMQLIGLLAKVTSAGLTALELNATERLPALRGYADAIVKMVEDGRDPSQAEIDALARGIHDDIAAVQARADAAKA